MGRAPFYHRKEIVVLRKIMNCDYNMLGSEWAGISDNAKNLIARCLTLNPDDRITAKEALEHEFFSDNNSDSVEDDNLDSSSDSIISNSSKNSESDHKVPKQKGQGFNDSTVIDISTEEDELSCAVDLNNNVVQKPKVS